MSDWRPSNESIFSHAEHSERAIHNAPTPTIPVNARSVSTRVGSRTRPRLQSNNTIVHHDDTDATDDGVLTPVPEAEVAPSPATTTGPATRTRKAKNTQLRLGVGRPAVAGGAGARAVTKSDSQSRVKRGKPSRTGRPTEDPIAEGTMRESVWLRSLDREPNLIWYKYNITE